MLSSHCVWEEFQLQRGAGFCQKQLGSLESSQLAQGRFIDQQIACPISQVHCGKNCPAVFLLRCTTMRALFLATARLLVHFCFAFFACPVGHIGTSHTRQPNTVQLNFNDIRRLSEKHAMTTLLDRMPDTHPSQGHHTPVHHAWANTGSFPGRTSWFHEPKVAHHR